jgi:hypothetical protein
MKLLGKKYISVKNIFMDANIPRPQDVNSKLKQSPTATVAPSQTKIAQNWH